MKNLLCYLKDFRKEVVLAPLFKMLEALFDLFVPLVVAAIIDRGIAASDFGYAGKMCLVLMLLAALGLAWSATAQYFAARASVGFSARLRRALFSHIQELSCSDLDTLGTSTLITRMTSDVNQVQNGLNLALRLLLRSPFIVFGAMIMAFTIDHRIAGIFALAIAALSVVVFGIMLISIPLYRRVQAALDDVLGKTRENLTGVRVVRAFRKEEDEVRIFREKNDALTALQKYVGRFSALMNPVTFVIINAATIWLIYAGALRVEAGSLTQGSVVALYNYMAQILVELVKLANLIISITRALACADRISDVLESGAALPCGNATAQPAGEVGGGPAPAVAFEHVSFTYAGAADDSLTDISFEAQSGETIGIIGGTGSGKSTLVNLIPRFYDATEGRVLIDGVPAQDYAAGELVRKTA
ncbi:MAG: ABC transporter ATP-binding protein, partial [Lachnospiraceae bacterium]|nr:ABC transporter ATP-binding protein [Lachnospiraceae bacterium]